ncbi:DNA polymerase IV [Acetobacterium carbinolicum]|uniref:Y-family DNA polymerase n=1 Tax=Acetobacterium carbinolicum TaxID=52690 RepID=UPI0039C9620D
MDRIILHVDMNSFYASVECLFRPELKGKPVAVGGDVENRHGIILAKNEEAKNYGVKTAEAIWEAKQKCPDLIILPPNFKSYQYFSKKSREIYNSIDLRVEPFSIDESWIQVDGGNIRSLADGKKIAEDISRRIKNELGLTVSIGVSWNKIFAKFGSDYKKPDAITVIDRKNYKDILYPCDVGDLLYVGRATKKKLNRIGIYTIGHLANASVNELTYCLGKVGRILWVFANGLDMSEVKTFDEETNGNLLAIKSIGNSMTTPRDLTCTDDVKIVVYLLAESVGMRLREAGIFANVVSISVRNKMLQSFTRQIKLRKPTDITKEIAEAALALFQNNYDFADDMAIRSMGVRTMSLVPKTTPIQLDFYHDEAKRMKQKKLEETMDQLRGRYGNNAIRRGITLGDSLFTPMDVKNDNVIHPMGYFQEVRK